MIVSSGVGRTGSTTKVYSGADFCINCKGNRVDKPNCTCPAGFYDDNVSVNCPACDI